MTHVQAFLKDEQGITTVEIILILVVLISLVIIFKARQGQWGIRYCRR